MVRTSSSFDASFGGIKTAIRMARRRSSNMYVGVEGNPRRISTASTGKSRRGSAAIDDIPDQRVLDDKVYAKTGNPRHCAFINGQGFNLHYYVWKSRAPFESRGIIIAVHGYTAHSRLQWLRTPIRQPVAFDIKSTRLPKYERVSYYNHSQGINKVSDQSVETVQRMPSTEPSSEMIPQPSAAYVEAETSNRLLVPGDERSFSLKVACPASYLSEGAPIATSLENGAVSNVAPTANTRPYVCDGNSYRHMRCPPRYALKDACSEVSSDALDGGASSDGDSGFDPDWRLEYTDSWIERLNNMGFEFWAMDLQGHGMSTAYKNIRGYFNSFDNLVDDVRDFIFLVRKANPDAVIYTLGTSLGSGILAHALTTSSLQEAQITGCVFLAGMFDLDDIKQHRVVDFILSVGNRFKRALQHWAPPIDVRASFMGPEERTSADHSSWRDYCRTRDPLRIKSPQIQPTHELIESCVRLRERAYRLSRLRTFNDCLFIHNKLDPVCSVDGSLAIYNSISSHSVTKRLIVLNGEEPAPKDSRIPSRYSELAAHTLPHVARGMDVGHTLTLDEDSDVVLDLVTAWLENSIARTMPSTSCYDDGCGHEIHFFG